ncbi:MAG TPA: SDR family NAD(P)-dependent oxidoreductase [Mycobacteriales bacterium]|jgi:meso-butanediol dehydrogenase/(S,S)-butanediol dehydrogenase/diacetyl reductase|nr:SDR family NAD(P)-dependent oxidoreductase [Mycobacteriales bacterium]
MGSSTFDFSGSVVLVTGAGSGIGQAIATAFLAAGATVLATGRRVDRLEATLAGNPLGEARALDVSDSRQVRALVADIVQRHGHLDVVVSNAGSYVPGPLTDVSDEAWADLRATNIDGMFYLAKAALPHLAESGGTLVAVSSVSGERGDWGQAAYNATKSAVSGFVRSLALDWGGAGVRVNAVAPAFTFTEATAGVGRDEASLAPFVNRIALGRPAEPADIAPVVLFLASEQAGYITGVVLPVDGGTSASTGQPHV